MIVTLINGFLIIGHLLLLKFNKLSVRLFIITPASESSLDIGIILVVGLLWFIPIDYLADKKLKISQLKSKYLEVLFSGIK